MIFKVLIESYDDILMRIKLKESLEKVKYRQKKDSEKFKYAKERRQGKIWCTHQSYGGANRKAKENWKKYE